jgi:hypothetical protein
VIQSEVSSPIPGTCQRWPAVRFKFGFKVGSSWGPGAPCGVLVVQLAGDRLTLRNGEGGVVHWYEKNQKIEVIRK